jgi:hypothetical protein
MATAKRFRRQAATCAILAAQTHDEESRQRYLRLEQSYLQLADTEEQQPVGASMSAGEREQKPAA